MMSHSVLEASVGASWLFEEQPTKVRALKTSVFLQEHEDHGRDNDVSAVHGIKKILPSVPDGTPLKLLERQTSSFKKSDHYKAFFLEYTLMTEYVIVHKMKIDGAYIVPSAGSPLKWFGVLFVRQGLYRCGVFKFILYVPDDYPNCECPLVVFEPPIFHPLINIETGEVDTKRAFRKWTKSNHLWQVVLYIKRMFYKIDTQLPLNPEAAIFYEKDLELFKLKVATSINLCNDKLYEKPTTDDQNAIWFSILDPAHYEEIRKKIAQQNSPDEEGYSRMGLKNGLSWVSKGTLKVFSNT